MEINPTLTIKQKEALKLLMTNNGVDEVLYGGAAGGGKSYLGCLWLIISAIKYPNTRWLMGRAKLDTLKATTLKTFFEVAAKLGLKEGTHYKYNQMNKLIKFFNQSEIVLKDLFHYPSDPEFDSLGSLEITGAFIDECNQISVKAKTIVGTRIRYKLDEFDLTPKILLTCNPARNWVYNDFYKKQIDGTIEDYKRFIPALNTDNQYITHHYVKRLEKADTITKNRLLYGNWEYQDELAMFNYDSILNMFHELAEVKFREQPLSKNIVITIDVARLGKDKTCIVVWDGLDVIDVIELSKTRINEQKDIIKELKDKYQIKNKQLIFDTDGVGGGLADSFAGCVEIVNNSKALMGENYQNLKTQLYYKLADMINSGEIVVYANDDIKQRLTQELQVLKRENADQDGRIQMTSKDSVKKQIGRSPDISDALAFRMHMLIEPAPSFSYVRIK